MPKGTSGTPMIICKICGKQKKYYAMGMCQSCYNKEYYRRYKSPIGICKICRKEKPIHGKNMCYKCYKRKWDGICRPTNMPCSRWTVKEETKLISLYSYAPWAEILTSLPGRTKQAIWVHAQKLKVRREIRRKWTERRSLGNAEGRQSGRIAEYKTAKLLYNNYDLVVFPAPETIYDLIVGISNIKLEVKSTKQNQWIIGPSQLKFNNFCDFLILWQNDEVFIVPYEYWIGQLKGRSNIHLKHVLEYKDRWDLLVTSA